MRNAATFDDDRAYGAALRKGAPRKPRAAAAGKTKKGAGRPLHRVARFAAIGMAASVACGIMVNALVLQKGHHPAPLFGKATAPVTTQVVPLPPVRAALVEGSADASIAAAKARKTVVATRDADMAAGDDAIGRLLAGGSASPAKVAGKADGKGEGRTVMGVQRALNKLGFKVPATGAAGPATKKAIEAFEKDRHMAVKGEVDRRLVKVLSAESGMKID